MPTPIQKTLRVIDSDASRDVRVVGYLLNQQHASPSWSGLTARVQNVAVEEQTFFDLTTDPGFRKYITGEVWIHGEVDNDRLINIDRSSFNRESADYQVLQRFLRRSIVEFKATNVQRPQRQKVAIRRRLEQHRSMTRALQQIAVKAVDRGDVVAPARDFGACRIPFRL